MGNFATNTQTQQMCPIFCSLCKKSPPHHSGKCGGIPGKNGGKSQSPALDQTLKKKSLIKRLNRLVLRCLSGTSLHEEDILHSYKNEPKNLWGEP